MTAQRYVSNELTHFVGRGKTEDEQYDILVNKILREGWLTFPPHDRRVTRSPAIDHRETISDGRMISHQVVCFCDIPLADFSIHMSKYSRFGIAFRRDFLIAFGANPVFYVVNNSPVAVDTLIPLTHLADRITKAMAERKIDRGLYFDVYLKVLLDLLWALDSFAHDYQGAWFKGSGQRDADRTAIVNMCNILFSLREDEVDRVVAIASSKAQLGVTLKNVTEFVMVGILDFLKCFDATKAEDDPDNYYMEREWRVPQNIKFELKDVARIIIPSRFAEVFRKDLPAYVGAVDFSD